MQAIATRIADPTMDGELEDSAHRRKLQVPLPFGQFFVLTVLQPFLFFPLLQPPPSPPIFPEKRGFSNVGLGNAGINNFGLSNTGTGNLGIENDGINNLGRGNTGIGNTGLRNAGINSVGQDNIGC